jgi:hypothetical protein
LSGYYRKHIKNFSELALPLTKVAGAEANPNGITMNSYKAKGVINAVLSLDCLDRGI